VQKSILARVGLPHVHLGLRYANVQKQHLVQEYLQWPFKAMISTWTNDITHCKVWKHNEP
jgi:hypothetical protein